MLNWTDKKKINTPKYGDIHATKIPSTGWPMGETVAQVEERFRKKQAILLAFSGIPQKK